MIFPEVAEGGGAKGGNIPWHPAQQSLPGPASLLGRGEVLRATGVRAWSWLLKRPGQRGTVGCWDGGAGKVLYMGGLSGGMLQEDDSGGAARGGRGEVFSCSPKFNSHLKQTAEQSRAEQTRAEPAPARASPAFYSAQSAPPSRARVVPAARPLPLLWEWRL